MVRITRTTSEFWCKGWGYDPSSCVYQTRNWRVFGVDEDGVEHIYAQGATEAEHDEWARSDPCWGAIQRAAITKLLDNPRTRDGVLREFANQAAREGDVDTALKYIDAMSWEARAKFDREVSEAEARRNRPAPDPPAPDPAPEAEATGTKPRKTREPKWKCVAHTTAEYSKARVPYPDEDAPVPSPPVGR